MQSTLQLNQDTFVRDKYKHIKYPNNGALQPPPPTKDSNTTAKTKRLNLARSLTYPGVQRRPFYPDSRTPRLDSQHRQKTNKTNNEINEWQQCNLAKSNRHSAGPADPNNLEFRPDTQLFTSTNTPQPPLNKLLINTPPENRSCFKTPRPLSYPHSCYRPLNMDWHLEKITIPTPKSRRTMRKNIRDPRLRSYRKPSPLPLTQTPRTIPLEYTPVAEARPCRPAKRPAKVNQILSTKLYSLKSKSALPSYLLPPFPTQSPNIAAIMDQMVKTRAPTSKKQTPIKPLGLLTKAQKKPKGSINVPKPTSKLGRIPKLGRPLTPPTTDDDRRAKKSKIFTLSGSDTDDEVNICLLYTSPSPRDRQKSRMPSSA